MKTPAYIFNKTELARCYNKIKSLLSGIPIHYALKANSNKEVLRILASINADFEVASLGEYEALVELGVDSKKIICGLPIKPIDWLEKMYKGGCRYFVFDSTSEQKKIIEYSPDACKILRIGIKDILPESIEYGMPYNEIIENLNQNTSYLRDFTDGISFHISNNIEISNFNIVINRIETILGIFNKPNMILNIGGGYRINADNDFFENLSKKISVLSKRYGVRIIAEPGNTIVNSSGRIRTTIIAIKKREDSHYDVYIDAGKPTGIKTDGKRIPTYITQITNQEDCIEREYRFIDITCMHRPHFSIKLKSILHESDILEFGGMGAYTLCLKNDFHAWSYPELSIE